MTFKEWTKDFSTMSGGAMKYVIGAAIVVASQALRSSELAAIESVRSGDKVLKCDMPDGTRDIDPALVVDLVDGKWLFMNGFSSTCVLVAP